MSDIIKKSSHQSSQIIQKSLEERQNEINADLILSLLKNKERSEVDLIDAILEEVAEELAHMKYERKVAMKKGRSTNDYSISRIEALKKLVDLIIKKKTLMVSDPLDVTSPKFQKVFRVWIDYFHSSMKKAGIPDETIELVFKQMRSDMVDWEKKMKSV